MPARATCAGEHGGTASRCLSPRRRAPAHVASVGTASLSECSPKAPTSTNGLPSLRSYCLQWSPAEVDHTGSFLKWPSTWTRK